jgi:hypothetical protein
MTSYLLKTPAGVVGAISRQDDTIVEDGFLSDVSGETPTAYGVPVKLNGSGKFAALKVGDTADQIYGVLVRNAPAISG